MIEIFFKEASVREHFWDGQYSCKLLEAIYFLEDIGTPGKFLELKFLTYICSVLFCKESIS